jgi:hypothetical protein
MPDLNIVYRLSITSGSLPIQIFFERVDEQNDGPLLIPIPFRRGKEHASSLQSGR